MTPRRAGHIGVRPEWLALHQEEAIEPDLPIIDAHHHIYDRPDNYVDTLKSRIEGIKDADVEAAAHEIIHPEAFTWVIVGDLKVIEKPIRALKLGEVKVLDVDGKVVR